MGKEFDIIARRRVIARFKSADIRQGFGDENWSVYIVFIGVVTDDKLCNNFFNLTVPVFQVEH